MVVIAALASFLALTATNLIPGAQAETAGSTTASRRVASGSIAAGYMNSCAVLANGSLRCWGGADHGILGRGTGVPAPGDTQYDIGDDESPASVAAVDLGAGRTARSISMRYKHICAVLDTGAIRCWGNGEGDVDTDLEGVLGTLGKRIVGDNETPASQAVVDLGAGRTAKSVAAGWLQTCAVLDTDEVKCWGQNNSGQLGIGNTVSPLAASSTGIVELGGSATAVSSGRMHSCALLTNGSVRCWGQNNSGQLGTGDTDNVGDNEAVSDGSTVSLGAGRTATAIAVGYEHSCAILDDGALRCWGRNDSGQLGLGTTQNLGDNEAVSSAATVNLGPGRTAVNVSAGYDNTCAVLDNGAVRCWGSNHIAQLGLGGEVPLQPGEVAPDENYHAALGDNELPTTVSAIGLGAASAVATGTYHSCALLADQSLQCWGAGNNGRTGHGDEGRVGDDETPGSYPSANVGGNVGAPVVTTTSTTPTTAAPTSSTPASTSTTAAPVTTPTTVPTTVPPTTTPPTPPPAADTTPPDLRMLVAGTIRTAANGRVCAYLTSDEIAITGIAVTIPGKGTFRSAAVGVGPTFPQFLCLTLPKSARPAKAVKAVVTGAALDRSVNIRFVQQTVTLTK